MYIACRLLYVVLFFCSPRVAYCVFRVVCYVVCVVCCAWSMVCAMQNALLGVWCLTAVVHFLGVYCVRRVLFVDCYLPLVRVFLVIAVRYVSVIGCCVVSLLVVLVVGVVCVSCVDVRGVIVEVVANCVGRRIVVCCLVLFSVVCLC